MAEFAASPMHYRNSMASTAADIAQMTDQTVPAERPVEAASAATFPLLMAALPGIFEFPTRYLPAAMGVEVEKPLAPALEPRKTELTTAGTRALDRPRERPPEMARDLGRLRIVTKSSQPVSLDLPLHQSPAATHTLKQHSPFPPMVSSRVPLTTLFGVLHDASPSREEQTEAQSGLQTMFNRL